VQFPLVPIALTDTFPIKSADIVTQTGVPNAPEEALQKQITSNVQENGEQNASQERYPYRTKGRNSTLRHVSTILASLPLLAGCVAQCKVNTWPVPVPSPHNPTSVQQPESRQSDLKISKANQTSNCPATSAQAVNSARLKNGPCDAGTNLKCMRETRTSH